MEKAAEKNVQLNQEMPAGIAYRPAGKSGTDSRAKQAGAPDNAGQAAGRRIRKKEQVKVEVNEATPPYIDGILASLTVLAACQSRDKKAANRYIR